jgi:hypothetical protein
MGVLPGLSDATPGRTQTDTTSNYLVEGRSWTDRHWWSLWAYATYYREFTIHSTSKTVITDSLKADNPIAIRYIGFDNGQVDVTSAGNVVMNGSIYNRNGNTNITSSSGSILQNGYLAIVGGNNIALNASTGIGSLGQNVLVNVRDGGKLDAISNTGDVRLKQVVGDLRIGTVGGAGVSNVVLEADRNLLNWNASSHVQGHRVELFSKNAGIGALNDPLIVRTGYTTDQTQWPDNGLMAKARDSINLKNTSDASNAAAYSGNLLLISADSAAGDVRIETTGKVIDNNPYETKDERTEQELANLWDALQLRGDLAEEKADEAVASFENGRSNNYQLYWQMRKSQPDGGAVYDPNYTYTVSQSQADALTAAGVNVTTFQNNRTQQYHQLHQEVGGLTSSYVATYHYTATTAEDAQIRKGSSWSDVQLQLPLGAGLLKSVTDTVTTIKEPNAKGRNVTLVAGSGIGSFNDPLTIDLTKGLDQLTQEQKAALAAAERGDATRNGQLISIIKPRSVNVSVGSGVLNAVAGNGLAFIGSEQDLRLDQISATGDIRIKTAGSLINGSAITGTANVIGNNLILEAGNGGIGAIPDGSGAVYSPLWITLLNGGGVTARSANDMWLESMGDLSVDTLFSRGDIRLGAEGSIFDFHGGESSLAPYNNLLGRNAWLTARNGSIGTWSNSFDIGVNPNGLIRAYANASGMDVYLNGPAGESFNIGEVTSGDAISLSSANAMKIDGSVSSPGPITLSSGGLTTMTTQASVHATALNLSVDAGALTMEDDGTSNAKMQVDAGTINITTEGDAIITGITSGNGTEDAVNITSRNGHIWAGHALGTDHMDIIADTAPAAKLTMWAKLGIGEEPLHLRLLNLEATSGGVMDIDVQGSVNIVGSGLTAADRVLFTAGGSITGNSITGQTVSLSAPVQVNVGAMNVGSNLQIASNLINTSVTGRNQVVGGSIAGFNGGIASNVNLSLSNPSGFAFTTFSAANANVDIPIGPLSVPYTMIVDRAIFTNPYTSMLVDQHSRTVQPFDVQLYSGGAPFSFDLFENRVNTDAYVIYRSPLHEVIAPSGVNRSAFEQVEDALARSRNGQDLEEEGETYDASNQSLISYTGFPVSVVGE